jgi:UDP-N-acetylmuramate dehydrogenase
MNIETNKVAVVIFVSQASEMMVIKEDFPLGHYNTFHVNANARYFAELQSIQDINEFLNSPVAKILPRFILGGGSNVLFTKDFDGVILHPVISGLEKVSENEHTVWLRVGAGESWDSFVEYCVSHELGGIENLSLIPGTVGASPVQNIGAYGVEAAEVIDSVEGVLLENKTTFLLHSEECRFSYRDSIFKGELKDAVFITHVTFRLQKDHILKTSYPDLEKELDNFDDTNIHTIREAVIAVRKKKLPDPCILGNAGSFFKNPVVSRDKMNSLRHTFPQVKGFAIEGGSFKLSAAWLIEHSGWKGRKLGRAGTYKTQPLILVNHGEATGEEILACAMKIQKAVMNHFAIKLETEVNVL